MLHDFRPQSCRWGHNLHPSTYAKAEPRKVSRGWFRKPVLVPRMSVLVHCTPAPVIGDEMIYQGGSGKDWRVKIVDVDPMWNPHDMFKLTFEEIV